ncbi:MAG: hypothetical protein NXH75_04665, partial [Halobacteriovoraceae bacterium]|nr:hypothetical protein [Halobacteriovoraceae bacterium]
RGEWETFQDELTLGEKSLFFTSELHFKRKGKKEVQKQLECSYLFDQKKMDEQMAQFCRDYPSGYGCSKK